MWDWILSLLSAIVSPDWGELVGLIPLAVAGVVALYLLFLLRRALSVPSRRLRPMPTPSAPAGVHMPGPSLAPFLAAFGAFCFFLALLFVKVGPMVDAASKPIPDSSTWTIQPAGVVALIVGTLALVGGLLFWGREATRDYDALEPRRDMALTEHSGPPPGVHVPGPSFRPFMASLALAAMLLGLALNPAIAAGGLVMLVVALFGWLRDARLEYREVERADATGHLENIRAPRFPTGTLAAFGLIFVFSLLVATGLIPPKSGSTASAGAGAAATSAKPAASSAGAAGGGAATPAATVPGGAAPSAVPGGPAAATLAVTASGVQYDVTDLVAPADKPFAITFTNNDAGIPHNISIHKDSPTGAEVWKGEIFPGVASRTYEVPALAAGTYGFVCTVHATMTGTLTVK